MSNRDGTRGPPTGTSRGAVRQGAKLVRLALDTSILVTLKWRGDTLESLIEDEDDAAVQVR